MLIGSGLSVSGPLIPGAGKITVDAAGGVAGDWPLGVWEGVEVGEGVVCANAGAPRRLVTTRAAEASLPCMFFLPHKRRRRLRRLRTELLEDLLAVQHEVEAF